MQKEASFLMTDPLYPLRFRPLLQRYLWGGRRLATVLDKPIGEEPAAESWEICDHGQDQSVVAAGGLEGTSLHDLLLRFGRELLGPVADRVDLALPPENPRSRFPLLVKFLDAAKTLSVQVHPDDRQAASLEPPDLGKTEAWVVLCAEPGSLIYAGLVPGTDRRALASAVAEGRCEEVLHRFEPRPGDCVFLPAGTVHALGAGLLVAEIQQSSNTTFRLYDWNRLGADGRPRPLHVEQALEVIDFDRGPVAPQGPAPGGPPDVERLVKSEKFVLDRRNLAGPTRAGGDGRFHVLLVLEGEIHVEGDAAEKPLRKGGTILIPAGLDAVEVRPAVRTAVMLDAYVEA